MGFFYTHVYIDVSLLPFNLCQLYGTEFLFVLSFVEGDLVPGRVSPGDPVETFAVWLASVVVLQLRPVGLSQLPEPRQPLEPLLPEPKQSLEPLLPEPGQPQLAG